MARTPVGRGREWSPLPCVLDRPRASSPELLRCELRVSGSSFCISIIAEPLSRGLAHSMSPLCRGRQPMSVGALANLPVQNLHSPTAPSFSDCQDYRSLKKIKQLCWGKKKVITVYGTRGRIGRNQKGKGSRVPSNNSSKSSTKNSRNGGRLGRLRVLTSCWIFADTRLLTGTPEKEEAWGG